MSAEYFEVRVEGAFLASHRIGRDGSAAPLHQHRWRVAVRAGSSRLDAIAIVVDFRRLRADLEQTLEALDGNVLEDHPDFAGLPATEPAVGEWLLSRLRARVVNADYRVVAVEVECEDGIRWVIGEDAVAARAPV